MAKGKRNLNTRLAVEIKKSGRSNRWYAGKVGVGEMTMSHWCKGQTKPNLDISLKLARLLNVPVDELFDI